jgi:hypothetical protein
MQRKKEEEYRVGGKTIAVSISLLCVYSWPAISFSSHDQAAKMLCEYSPLMYTLSNLLNVNPNVGVIMDVSAGFFME